MSTSLPVVIGVIVVALLLAAVVGRVLTRRAGVVRSSETDGVASDELGLPQGQPAILHFSADWCGPCQSVRHVIDEVCSALPGVAHVEIDMDANPPAARELSVMSLPTTFIFDADGKQRYRTSGVPKAADLRSALEPLLA